MLPSDAVITGVTGPQIRGVMVGADRPLCFASTELVRRRGLRVARVQSLPQHRDNLARPEHCWHDAARDLGLVELVTAGDWLVHLHVTTREALVDYAVQAHHVRGGKAARAAADLVCAGVESPRETRVRLMLVLAGLPTPECNVDVDSQWGFIGRPDMLYRQFGLIVEYDGGWHAQEVGRWESDVERQGTFEDDGWRVVRVTNRQLRSPRRVVHRVCRHLIRGGYLGPAPVFDASWRSSFG